MQFLFPMYVTLLNLSPLCEGYKHDVNLRSFSAEEFGQVRSGVIDLFGSPMPKPQAARSSFSATCVTRYETYSWQHYIWKQSRICYSNVNYRVIGVLAYSCEMEEKCKMFIGSVRQDRRMLKSSRVQRSTEQ
jgi:hypothetical protein